VTTLDDASILIVDDEPANVMLLRRILANAGFSNVVGTTDPHHAVALFGEHKPDIVLLDLHMPVLDGFGVLRALDGVRSDDTYLPVLVLTADITDEAKHVALRSGATDFVTKPFDVTEVVLRIRNLLSARVLHVQAQFDTARRLTIAAEARDDETADHIERVGTLSGRLARGMGMPEHYAEMIAAAAALHDVGKIGVPDSVLLKAGPLDDEEFEIMRSHTVIGKGILAQARSPVLQLAAEVAYGHHERWDGEGYPNGARGETIPISARIVAVADAFDAMTNNRRYRAAQPVEAALAEIQLEGGRQFDAAVCDALGVVLG
jgi:putative two-component system response regulator